MTAEGLASTLTDLFSATRSIPLPDTHCCFQKRYFRENDHDHEQGAGRIHYPESHTVVE
jgi:hypothetical protein